MKQLTQAQASQLDKVYFKTIDTIDQHRFSPIYRNTEQGLRDHIDAEIKRLNAMVFADESSRQYWLDYYNGLAIVKVSESNFAV